MAEKNNVEEDRVTKPLCKLIKEDKLEELKGYIPVREFGIYVERSLNIDIVAINRKFGLNGYDDAVAIECKYGDDINDAIKNALGQALSYQTSFKKVYIAVNKGSNPNVYVNKILKKLGIGLITLRHKRAKVKLSPKSDTLDLFSRNLYKKNTLYRGFLIAAFARACEANGYSKRDLHFDWKGSKNREGSKKKSLHIWMEMPIIKDKLRIGCAYSLKLNKKNEPEKVKEAALRLSIKGLDYDKSIKEQIAKEFPCTRPKRAKKRGPQEWDCDLRSLIEENNTKGIQKIIKDRVRWVNNNLKDKIS